MSEPKRTALEFLVVLVVGAILGFAANAASPRGLKLSQNYFPKAPTAGPATTQLTGPGPITPGSAPATQATSAPVLTVEERLRKEGIQVISDADVWTAYQDPMREQGMIVFVDARNDEHYTQGHIPGAYQLDHYYIDKYIGEVLPKVQAAEKTIVYCEGGDCEDSEFTAIELLNRGADKSRLYVYTGGMKEWRKDRRPIERGARDSRDIVEATP